MQQRTNKKVINQEVMPKNIQTVDRRQKRAKLITRMIVAAGFALHLPMVLAVSNDNAGGSSNSDSPESELAFSSGDQSRDEETLLVIGRGSIISISGLSKTVQGVGISIENNVEQGLSFGAKADYWQFSLDSSAYTDQDGYHQPGDHSLTVGDLSLGAYAKYLATINGAKLKPYGIIGIAHHMFTIGDSNSSLEFSETGFDFGVGGVYTLPEDWLINGQFTVRNIDVFDFTEISVGLGKSF